jgi:hypothetical protein
VKINEKWLDDHKACGESYKWVAEQKNKECNHILNKLYDEEKYNWCLFGLYHTNIKTKILIWGLIISSYLLSGVLIMITANSERNMFFVAAGVAAAVLVAAVLVAAVLVAAVLVAAGGVAVAAAAGVVAVAAAAGVAVAAAVLVAAGVVAAGVVAGDYITKLFCKILLKRRSK